MAIRQSKLMRRRWSWLGSKMDCGDEGCGRCRVCRRLAFHEYVSAVAPRDIPCRVVANDVDVYIRRKYGAIIDHDFHGWREFADGRGGETVCSKCGVGAMSWSLRTGI